MPTLILRREHFIQPEQLSPAWTLMKGAKTVVCGVWSHEFGFELRALVGAELVKSRSTDRMMT